MPDEGYPVSPKEELLTFEEIARVVHIAANLGITKVRLTGGEPLIRKDLPELIMQIRKHPKITDISSTTNGYLLSEMAEKLARAGLNRVNVSLDTLVSEKFTRIARRGELKKVLKGIEAAMKAKLQPIKINCVLMRGVNDDEVVDFAKWTQREEIHVRFIELMPIQWNLDDTEGFDSLRAMQGSSRLFRLRKAKDTNMLDDTLMRRMLIPSEEVKKHIEDSLGNLIPTEILTNGPARTYRLLNAKGTIGFISQISNDLCEKCNRLRLTADGQLRPCLMSDGEVDLRTPLRNGASDEAIADLILHVVRHKPERHYLAEGQKVTGRGMNQIGG